MVGLNDYICTALAVCSGLVCLRILSVPGSRVGEKKNQGDGNMH